VVALEDVQAARRAIAEHVCLSPCARSETLSRLSRTQAFLKLENLQMTGAYKEPGGAHVTFRGKVAFAVLALVSLRT
jgi:threonine dehydratase